MKPDVVRPQARLGPAPSALTSPSFVSASRTACLSVPACLASPASTATSASNSARVRARVALALSSIMAWAAAPKRLAASYQMRVHSPTGEPLALLEQRPHVPVPANDRYAGDAVEALLGRGRAPEVEWQHRQRAVDVVARALRHEVTKVAAVVAHGGVLPVDEADVIAVDEQVGAVEVVVAQHGTPRAGAHGAHEPRYLLLALLEVVRQGPALVAQQAHDLSRLVVEVEPPRLVTPQRCSLRAMERAWATWCSSS